MESISVTNQFDILFTAVENYPYDELFHNLKDKNTFLAGKSLNAKQFKNSELNSNVLTEIEEKLKDTQVIVMIGAIKTGTSSIGNAWEAKKSKSRKFAFEARTMQDARYQELANNEKIKEIFLDEFSDLKEDAFSQVKGFVEKGKKLILRVFPISVDNIRQKLDGDGINFTEVMVLPIKDDEMTRYLSKSLSLSEDDKLIKFITSVSGGSHLVAQIICNNLIYHSFSEKESEFSASDFRGLLKQSLDQVNSLQTWNKERALVPEDLKKLYPDPILQGVKIN